MNIEQYINKEMLNAMIEHLPMVNEYKETLIKDFERFVEKTYPVELGMNEDTITIIFGAFIHGFNTPYFENSFTGSKMRSKFADLLSEEENETPNLLN